MRKVSFQQQFVLDNSINNCAQKLKMANCIIENLIEISFTPRYARYVMAPPKKN